jgi:exonuclease SbcD
MAIMRVLHTADWHLADRLGRQDRTADLRAAVERVVGICESEKVDLLLIAGDLFSELAGAEALRETIRHLQEVFAELLKGGATIAAITGNHDRENFCQTLRHAMALASPITGAPGEVLPAGRLFLATEPALVRVEDRASGLPVQLLLMPYPSASRYLTDEPLQKYQGLDEKNRLLTSAFKAKLRSLREGPGYSTELPAILVAHIAVRGSELPTLFRLSDTEDVVFDDRDLPSGIAYTALGHIHKPQLVGGSPAARYSGSIERMDLGEKGDEKGVVLFDIGPDGLIGEPWTVPLPSTPIYEVTISNPAVELPALRAMYPDAARHLVKVRCTYTAGRESREEVVRELDALFPRWYDREITEASALGPSLVTEPSRGLGLEETVREYVKRELVTHDDAVQEAVLARLEALLREAQD